MDHVGFVSTSRKCCNLMGHMITDWALSLISLLDCGIVGKERGRKQGF